MAEYVFTLRNVRKAHGDKVVLDNVTLSFLHGAKIGVVGPNGTGKSSLLRIMAGEDDGFTGEARLTPGFTVGILHQEPNLDPAKDMHMHEGSITFVDDDHIEWKWSGWEDGKAADGHKVALTLVRTKK